MFSCFSFPQFYLWHFAFPSGILFKLYLKKTFIGISLLCYHVLICNIWKIFCLVSGTQKFFSFFGDANHSSFLFYIFSLSIFFSFSVSYFSICFISLIKDAFFKYLIILGFVLIFKSVDLSRHCNLVDFIVVAELLLLFLLGLFLEWVRFSTEDSSIYPPLMVFACQGSARDLSERNQQYEVFEYLVYLSSTFGLILSLCNLSPAG